MELDNNWKFDVTILLFKGVTHPKKASVIMTGSAGSLEAWVFRNHKVPLKVKNAHSICIPISTFQASHLESNFKVAGPLYLSFTPPKFNSSSLENGGWKTTLLLGRYITF